MSNRQKKSDLKLPAKNWETAICVYSIVIGGKSIRLVRRLFYAQFYLSRYDSCNSYVTNLWSNVMRGCTRLFHELRFLTRKSAGTPPNNSPKMTTGPGEVVDLFPQIEPYDTGRLRVDEIHELYYEQSGKPNGNPVLFMWVCIVNKSHWSWSTVCLLCCCCVVCVKTILD